MLLAILIVAVALGADPELQILSILFRAPTNGAFMGIGTPLPLLHAPHIGPSAMNLLWRIAMHTLHPKEKENEIAQRKKSHQAISRMYDDSNPGKAD